MNYIGISAPGRQKVQIQDSLRQEGGGHKGLIHSSYWIAIQRSEVSAAKPDLLTIS